MSGEFCVVCGAELTEEECAADVECAACKARAAAVLARMLEGPKPAPRARKKKAKL